MSEKFKFQAIPRSSSVRWNAKEQSSKGEYVKYGEDNLFPQHLIDLLNNSAIHNTCINAIVDGIVGEGLHTEQEWLLDKANTEGQSWNDIFKRVALDYKTFGGFSLEVIWSHDRSKIAEVYHIDFSMIRSKEKDYRGKVEGYYLSNEWREKGRFRLSADDLVYIPAFDEKRKAEQPSQLLYVQPYRPGQEYYPLPDYVGALKVIELDAEVDNFHVNNVKNGLAPSLSITTFTNSNDEERRVIENMLRTQYGGTDNAGSLLYIDVASIEEMPEITPIPQNGADGYYTSINDMVEQKILTAHRITSPMILGIKTPGQLGGREEVIDAYLLLLNTVIKPMQQEILDIFQLIFDINYNNSVNLGIIQLKLYEDGTEEVDVVTATDAEVGDDAELEADIEQADRNAGMLIDSPIAETEAVNQPLPSLV